MTELIKLAEMLNAMRENGYTPHHWEASQAAHDALVLRANELRLTDLSQGAPSSLLSGISHLYGLPFKVRSDLITDDVMLIAAEDVSVTPTVTISHGEITRLSTKGATFDAMIATMNAMLLEPRALRIVVVSDDASPVEEWTLLSVSVPGSYTPVFSSFSAISVIEEAFRRITPKKDAE